MSEIVVLLGAGASSGCASTIPRPPPLGNELHAELGREFPLTWGRMSSTLRTAFEQNFEVGMSELLVSGSMGTNHLMREFAQYFARFQLSGPNPYDRFVERLEKGGVLDRTRFATLNYECLLELAISNRGRTVTYLAREPASKDASIVWKPHGSCNFIPRGLAIEGVGLDPRIGVDGGSIEPVQPNEVAAFCNSGTSLYPAMALYTKGKPSMMTSRVLQAVQGWVSDAIREADATAIVGVRPNPDDPHVWEPIAQAKGRVLYVGNQKEFGAWRAANRTDGPSEVVGSRFEDSASLLADRLLEAG